MPIEVGSVVEGKVTGITSFGAFVKLPGGSTGLVHISEIADTYVKDVRDYLKEDQTVKVRVLSMRDGRISLSIKAADEQRQKKEFEDKLARFLKKSEERLKDIKKSEEKRGSYSR